MCAVAEELANVFRSACSQNLTEVQWAESRLQELSQTPGGLDTFWTSVVIVITEANLDVGTRWQAALYFKNAVDTIWRNKITGMVGPNALSATAKKDIRYRLLNSIAEPVEQLSRQLVVIISKVARIDWSPPKWPELIPALANAIEVSQPGDIRHGRSLATLHHVIKQLASRRLPSDRKRFNELTDVIVPPIYRLWKLHVGNIAVGNSNAVMCALYCTKILRYTIYYGFAKPHVDNDIISTVDHMISAISDLLTARALFEDEAVKSQLENCVKNILKFILDIIEIDAVGFVCWLRRSLVMAVNMAFTDKFSSIPPCLLLRLMNLIKLAIITPEYKYTINHNKSLTEDDFNDSIIESLTLAETDELSPAPAAPNQLSDPEAMGTAIVNEVLHPAQLVNILKMLIQHHLGLSSDDLERWEQDAENFATLEDNEAWRFSLRPAAESLYVAIMHEHWPMLAKTGMAEWFNHLNEQLDINDLPRVIERDSLYCAMGLGANELYDSIDFESFFTNVALVHIENPQNVSSPNFRILQRRILWLCGKWVGVRLGSPFRPLLYRLVSDMMQSNKDIAVRITGARTLRNVVDDIDFDEAQFIPHLGSFVEKLTQLLQECSEADSHLHLVSCLTLIADRTGASFKEHMAPLFNCLPALWSTHHGALHASILALFIPVVKASGPSESLDLCRGLSPMVSSALDLGQDSSVVLLEDGLELWLTLLEHSPCPLNEHLMALFAFMPNLLSIQSENLKLCLEIVRAYFTFQCSRFAEVYTKQIIDVCHNLLSSMRSEGVAAVLRTVESLLKCDQCCDLVRYRSLLLWCARAILNAEEIASVICLSASVLAVASLKNFDAVLQIVEVAGNESGIANPLDCFIDQWFERAPILCHDLERRKLMGMWMTQWLATCSPAMERHFKQLIAGIYDSLMEVSLFEDDKFHDSLSSDEFIVQTDPDSALELNEHDKRIVMLKKSDPVYTVSLNEFVVERLNQVEQKLGVAKFSELWSECEDDVRYNFLKYCNIQKPEEVI